MFQILLWSPWKYRCGQRKGFVKSLVYADKPQTLDHLEDNIRCVIAAIRPQMLEKVIENWTTSEPAVAVLCQKSYLKVDDDNVWTAPFLVEKDILELVQSSNNINDTNSDCEIEMDNADLVLKRGNIVNSCAVI
ncbi:hypothetical protein TNCV_4637561 [Trichonephila clavipes]|nr:hypothetical protein TNCV_4637561 [Trichonephila clavipes]